MITYMLIPSIPDMLNVRLPSVVYSVVVIIVKRSDVSRQPPYWNSEVCFLMQAGGLPTIKMIITPGEQG